MESSYMNSTGALFGETPELVLRMSEQGRSITQHCAGLYLHNSV